MAKNYSPQDSDEHIGAVEGDRAGDSPQHGNRNADEALNDSGVPKDRSKVCEDVIGANEDQTQG